MIFFFGSFKGAIFKYNSCLTGIIIKNNKIKEIVINNKEIVHTDILVLAIPKFINCFYSVFNFFASFNNSWNNSRLNKSMCCKKTSRTRTNNYWCNIFISEILYSYKPHIGTDILREVIKNMREYLISKGAIFKYNSCLTGMNQ